MVADREIVQERCARIRRYVNDLRGFAVITREAFKQNRERQYAVQHALQLAIEACLEIGSHICAADALGVPASYAETFDLLLQGGVVDAGLAGKLRMMARFRNRIVHFYWEVDLDDLYGILTDRLGDFNLYLAAIEKYLALENRGTTPSSTGPQ